MKREDISRIFEGASEEQMKALLDINSADITHALGKQKGDLETAKAALDAANATIADLKGSASDAAALQAKIDAYEQAETNRKAEEKAAAERAELMERMDAALGDRNFIHSRMRDVVAADFAEALKDRANRGKSDREIFDAITQDQGYFASQNPPPANMPNMGGAGAQMDAEKFRSMSLYDQFVFANEHPEEAKKYM